jgi:hypothetical protein
MIESGQQFGLYVVKDVFETDQTQACCCAEDPFFNREVTLKVYSAKPFYQGDRLEQFEAKLERLAVLDHPSIAPIYDSGLEEEFVYYTSACYAGGNLAQRLTSVLPAEEALKTIYELTEAFEYAAQQGVIQSALSAEKVCFDDNGRAVMTDFAVEQIVTEILTGKSAEADPSVVVAETLRNLGELLLKMLLGPGYSADARIDDLCAKLESARVRRLVGRFLLPGEWRFASFSELLEELRCFDEVEEQLNADASSDFKTADRLETETETNASAVQQTEKMVADVRRLVAEKNSLQQALDNALYERNLADTKLNEGQRQLAQIREEVEKVKEEANVAWELVAGQKYDRWRPAIWAMGGFLIGFVLSGSYGYYYSEQARNELMAKLQANEELIKTAAWRPAEEVQQTVEKTAQELAPVIAEADDAEQSQSAAMVTEAEQQAELETIASVPLIPEKEEPRQWWPAGSEFSAAAAIPIEQIKAALGVEAKSLQGDLPEALRREVIATVQRWAESWSRQDLSGYFSAYSENYRPELGRSQQEWRDLRRSRVTRPEWIELNLDDIRLRKISDDRIQVKLRQSYRSDFYQDQILKSINLIREQGEWRILMERSLGMVDPHEDIIGG